MKFTRRSLQGGFAIGLSLLLLGYLASAIDFNQASDALAKIPVTAVFAVALLLTASTLIGGLRLYFILGDIGTPVSIWIAAKAMLLSTIGGLVFFQIVGQTITRIAILRRVGIPVSAIFLATVYERVISTVLVGTAAGIGVVYLIGRLTINDDARLFSLVALVASMVLALGFGVGFSYRDLAGKLLRAMAKKGTVFSFIRVVLLTVFMQGPILVSFVLLGLAVEPSVSLIDLIAASSIVMFAAALPISLGGWGVRELGALYAFGVIGIAAPDAVVIAIILGVISQLVLLAAAGFSFIRSSVDRAEQLPLAADEPVSKPKNQRYIWSWIIPISVATLVLFQVRLPIGTTDIMVNLADPLAVVGMALFAHSWARLAFRRSVWSPGTFEIFMLLATVVISLGLVIGWSRVGFTNWAFVNRYIGWFVLVAYMSTGALVVLNGGVKGLGIVGRTFVSTMAALIVVDIATRFVVSLSSFNGIYAYGGRMEGLAGNPNAFSFQVLTAIVVLLALSTRRNTGNFNRLILSVAGGLFVTALWLSSSRAGFVGFVAIVSAAIVLNSLSLKRSVVFLAVGLVFVGGYEILNAGSGVWFNSDDGVSAGSIFQTREYYEDSNDGLRVESLLGGLNLWLSYPVFGAGIGVFLQGRIEAFGIPLVIHNSALWILAEMGLVGLAVFATGIFVIVKNAWAGRALPVARRQHRLLLLLVVFMGVHATFHDMLFQRGFWFFLGACVAVPAALVRARAAERDRNPSILYVIGSLARGGAETHVAGLVTKLKAQGFNPMVYCTGEAGPLARRVREAGIEVFAPRPARTFIRRWLWVRVLMVGFGLFRLINLMRAREPAIVHFFLPEAYIIGGLAAVMARCPRRIMSRRSLNDYQSRRPLLAGFEKRLHPSMDFILGNSAEVVRQLRQEENIPPQKLGLIRNGVNTVKFSPDVADISYRDTLGLARDAILITIVANLIPYKGHKDLLIGLGSVKDDLPAGWRLAIVGRDDGEGAVLGVLTNELDLVENTVFLGERADTPNILAVSDIALNTSHEEGFSNAVLEGMSAGLPLVVTRVGGNPEAVIDRETGFIVPARSPWDLGAAIARLAASENLRRQFGDAGRARVISEFSDRKCLDHYERLYRALVAGDHMKSFSIDQQHFDLELKKMTRR